jgi:hypothetical protein
VNPASALISLQDREARPAGRAVEQAQNLLLDRGCAIASASTTRLERMFVAIDQPTIAGE